MEDQLYLAAACLRCGGYGNLARALRHYQHASRYDLFFNLDIFWAFWLIAPHADSWSWADVSKADANQTMIQEKFYASWLQIAKTLSCKTATVAFEPINEPPGTTAEHAEHLDKLNKLFLKALAATGGYNSQRVVTLSNLGMGADKIQFFKRPENITNPWAYQFHMYSPYDFVFSAW